MRKSLRSPEQQRLQCLLRKARENAALTQAELAKRLGKPQSFVSKYECGERRLDLPELEQVSAVLGIPLVELVESYVDRPGTPLARAKTPPKNPGSPAPAK